MDALWRAAEAYAAGEKLAGCYLVGPPELRPGLDVSATYEEAGPADIEAAEVVVLHKGRYREMDRRFLKGALDRLKPSFANEVFIVLTSNDELPDDQRDHLGTLDEIMAWCLGSSAAVPETPAVHKTLADRIALARWWEALRKESRALESKRLTRFGAKVFSQNDEDGIIQEIFSRIGVQSRRFIEFGIETGAECNTCLLLQMGWSGLWMDGSAVNIAAARRIHHYAVADGRLDVQDAFISAENIDQLIETWILRRGAGRQIDLLSIDIDRNDYWVWRAIECLEPRVVVVEYNAHYPPVVDFVVPYAADQMWDETNYYGASLSMLERLGREKGYSLVGCCLAGVNAFFVRSADLVDSSGDARFHAPYTATEHYEPVRHGLCGAKLGHRPGYGPNGVETTAGAS